MRERLDGSLHVPGPTYQARAVAGAPAVVASLWQVNDASTPELMWDFSARLEAGRREAQFLRRPPMGGDAFWHGSSRGNSAAAPEGGTRRAPGHRPGGPARIWPAAAGSLPPTRREP